MKKQTKMILAVLVLLFLAILILAYLNQRDLGDSKAAQENATVLFQIQDDQGAVSDEFEANRSFFYDLPAEEFAAAIHSNGKQPQNVIYRGVSLIELIKALGFDLNGKKQMVVRSADGYTVAVALDEVLEPDNVYLTYQLNGEEMKSMKEGGNGPYQLVLRKDDFSQRWAKYVTEVIFQ